MVHPSKATDTDYREHLIKSVKQERIGAWDIGLDDGMHFGFEHESIAPEVGQVARMYGRGSFVRGLDIAEQEVYYRTPEEEDERHRQWCEQWEKEKQEIEAMAPKEADIEAWFACAKDMTPEGLTDFVNVVMNKPHSYNTVVSAVAACAYAGAQAANHHASGGITGFQAGAVMWEFIRYWENSGRFEPMRLVRYEHMLYPQYDYKFERRISKDTWEWLQKRARELLTENRNRVPAPAVLGHWLQIDMGIVPFDYTVEDDRRS